MKIEMPQKKLEALNETYKVEKNTTNSHKILCKIFVHI